MVFFRDDKKKIVEMANGFEPVGKQKAVFGSGDAGEKIKEMIGLGE